MSEKSNKLLGFLKDLKNNKSAKESEEAAKEVKDAIEKSQFSKTKIGAAVILVLGVVITVMEIAFQVSELLG